MEWLSQVVGIKFGIGKVGLEFYNKKYNKKYNEMLYKTLIIFGFKGIVYNINNTAAILIEGTVPPIIRHIKSTEYN